MSRADSLPNKPGVYLFKDRKGSVLYVGKAKNLRKRVKSYFTKEVDIKTKILLGRLYDIDYIITGSELDALLLEDKLIKNFKPRYNISLKDDKAYPYLKLTINEKWPRLFLARRKQADGALYFGPFQGGMVREIIRFVKKLFPIRWCKETPLKKRRQPCLYYRIGSCSGPCVGKIKKAAYDNFVKGIVLLLKGKTSQAIIKLTKEMSKESKNRNYEKAAALRDRIQTLEKMLKRQDLPKAPQPRLLASIQQLKTKLKLNKAPVRIEAFDISNIGGTNMVGSMVTFYAGLPLKSDYRRFRIKSFAHKPNDVAAIAEVVSRRYNGSLAKKLPWPDLILIDGGPGQLKAAQAVLPRAIAIVSLAKREEEVFFPGKQKPLKLKKEAESLQLLQRIRDEAHRFAVSYHRQKRSKNLFQ